jgi:hypothetical protein
VVVLVERLEGRELQEADRLFRGEDLIGVVESFRSVVDAHELLKQNETASLPIYSGRASEDG